MFFVVIAHFPRVNGNYIFGSLHKGLFCVEMLFILSGYLITRSYLNHYADLKNKVKTFYFRRIFRTWPVYYFVLLMYLAFPQIREFPGDFHVNQFLFFFQNWKMDMSTFSYTWSLCIEEQFYLIFPFLVILANYKPFMNDKVLLFILVFVGLATRFWLWQSLDIANSVAQENLYRTFLYYPTWTRFDGLAIGMFLAKVERINPLEFYELEKSKWTYLVGAISFVLALFVRDNKYSFFSCVLHFPLAALSMGCFFLFIKCYKGFFEKKAFRFFSFIATISYSLYLTNRQSFTIATRLLEQISIKSNSAQGILVSFFLVLGIAIFVYILVEKPGLSFRDKMVKKWI